MSKKNKEYFQIILDKDKEHEKRYLDFLEEMINKKGMKKKDIFLLGLEKLMQKDNIKDTMVEVFKEEKVEVIEEIKDLKLMLKALANGNVAFTTIEKNEEEIEIPTVEVDTSGISEDDMNF